MEDDPEKAVLAVVLLTGGECFDDVSLTADDFHDPKNADAFTLMLDEWSAGRPVEPLILSDKRPDLSALLFGITSLPVTAGSAAFYGDIVRKNAMRRRLSSLAGEFNRLATDMDADDLAEAARGIVDRAIGGEPARSVEFVADVLPRLEERMRQKDVFVPSPWGELDNMIGGLRPGAVYVVAARPGAGKTIVAGQMAVALAEHGLVSFSSLEMTSDELVARMVSERLQINVGHIKDSRMTDFDWNRLENGRDKVADLSIAIDDRSGVSATDVRAFARSVSRKGKLAAVIVDYMQLMTSKDSMDRHLQVADFSRRLKILAKDFQVPVIALSQLNRNSTRTELGIPKLSDLRESGAIEQDADVVFLLRREGDFPHESLVIDVAKNRHGETGEVMLSWDGGFSRAVEWDSPGTSGGSEW